ncbi:hypothetical protein V3F56_09775 [Moorellaceae bacterium AZ2]
MIRKRWISLSCTLFLLVLGALAGCQSKEAVKESRLFGGLVTAAQEGDKEIWTGWLRDSQGKEVTLFKFTVSDAQVKQNYSLFPRRFFAWGPKYLAHCGAEQKDVILIDYKTQKEIFRQQLPERATYLSAQPQGDKFLVATEKALYLLQPGEGSSFTLKRLKEGVFHWPALSPDGQQVAAGKEGGKEPKGPSVEKKLSPDQVGKRPGVALVILDVSSGEEREMLSPFLDRQVPDTTYRIITSVAWSPDGKRVVAGTTSPADPRIERLVSVDVANGQVHELLETTQLYTPPGSFTPDGKYYLFSQGKPDYREFLGEGDQYTGPRVSEPFRAKIGLLEVESGKISYLQNIPPDLHAYWPLTEAKTDLYFHDSDPGGYIYFLDQDHYNWVRFLPEGSLPATGVYRVPLQGGQPERLFEVRGLVSYAVFL